MDLPNNNFLSWTDLLYMVGNNQLCLVSGDNVRKTTWESLPNINAFDTSFENDYREEYPLHFFVLLLSRLRWNPWRESSEEIIQCLTSQGEIVLLEAADLKFLSFEVIDE